MNVKQWGWDLISTMKYFDMAGGWKLSEWVKIQSIIFKNTQKMFNRYFFSIYTIATHPTISSHLTRCNFEFSVLIRINVNFIELKEWLSYCFVDLFEICGHYVDLYNKHKKKKTTEFWNENFM